MLKISTSFLFAFLLWFWYFPEMGQPNKPSLSVAPVADSLPNAKSWPEQLNITNFSTSEWTPSPACLAVAPGGAVYVGVDKMGSLGKKPDHGSIVKLIDSDNDGKVDRHTIFALADNPRGIIVNGDKVYVLHTVFSKETGKASGMDLVVFEDKDQDGVADGPSKPLIEHISNANFLRNRGTDHATNGIRMGIDGWIYIAVGDFGFHEAIDRSGTKLTMLGGGIVRVRPDGTEMEVYTHGLRNIYDLAIDPLMNIFARGNTNDGGGWNVRFSHQIQSGEYGYPVLFKNFTEEILPALIDVGGGSGTGALFMDDPTWPDQFNKVPMMADWGRSQLYIHRVTADGASYKQKEEEFIKLAQITDLDVDGSGRLYLSAWDGAGYSGNPGKGFVVRAVPKDWVYRPFADVSKASVKQLGALLQGEGAVARLAAQQELLKRSSKSAIKMAWKVASNSSLSPEARVAGIYTYAQLAGEQGIASMVKLAADPAVQETVLRALSDRKGWASKVPVEPFLEGLTSSSERVRIAAMIGLGRLDRKEVAATLLATPVPASFVAPAKGTEGPHATPNAAIIPAHIAVRTLVNLGAVDACVKAIGTKNNTLALWALRYMHDPKAVSGLISAYASTDAEPLKKDILSTLSRLYLIEADYDGSWWWSTRPDTHGPYYKGVQWTASPQIKKLLEQEFAKADDAGKQFFADLNAKNRMGITEFGGEEQPVAKEEKKIDLEKIKNKKGQVGEASIEDVMLAIEKIPGDAAKGKELFTMQGCIACHSINKGETMKGPFMGQIGSIMSRQQIAESILKPNASISQGFASVLITAKGDKSYMGFVTQESATKLVLRDIAGQVYTIKTEDIVSRQEMEDSMMPAGLANALSYEEFASLITFLSKQKK
ncbi:putative heme-binding domain-containing protein [Dyadobacter jejuensis]|uniref:Putative heme-binding domain-containing protein n=1 Tax=Dyadobacter jejuensis TaxID=1082580 RepID=A0A316ADW3_9BACT|nr:c-type cytochrome [Dyadobacter jejuensis]PWJ55943.1 putative heme-binding domain-containing protein [Dyadobacter jejuensis]